MATIIYLLIPIHFLFLKTARFIKLVVYLIICPQNKNEIEIHCNFWTISRDFYHQISTCKSYVKTNVM